MAFFDDLGKKISQASQSAVQKTKDMAEVAKLNGQISDEEKKLNNYYYQIGKLYVKLHRDNYDVEFAKLMGALKQAEDQIRSCQKQVQDLKGIIRCAKCGTEVPNTAAFCNACGAAIVKKVSAPDQSQRAETTVIMCSGCGAVVDKNMRFCTSCGGPVGAAVPNVAVPTATPEPTPVQTAANQCPNCGAAVSEDLAFCVLCGVQLK